MVRNTRNSNKKNYPVTEADKETEDVEQNEEFTGNTKLTKHKKRKKQLQAKEKDDAGEAENAEESSTETDTEDTETDKEDTDKEDTDQEDGGTDSTSPVFAIIIIIAIPVLVVVVSMLLPSSKATHIDVQSSLKDLFNDFKNQPQISHRKLKSRAGTFINHTTSPQPFVLMVAACEDDQHAADCFANRVGYLFTPVPLILNGSTYSGVDSEEAKSKIDDKLKNIFQTNQFPTVAVIHNLQAVPYDTSMLFYKYCDHDHPSYNEAAIIFTVSIPREYCTLSLSEVENDGIVEMYLSEKSLWANDKNFNINKVGALLSRISDTVIFLRSETRESLDKFC